MTKLWRRYKPFISAGMQEMITYRLHFFLWRIGDVMGAFVAFYLWKAVFDSSSQALIRGFDRTDMTFYILMSFVTTLLIKSDSYFMIGEEVREGSIVMRLLRPVHFATSFLFTELGSKWILLMTIGFPFMALVAVTKLLAGTPFFQVLLVSFVYLFSLALAFLIHFYFNLCFGFSAFVLKNLWGTNLLKDSLVAFLSGGLLPLAFLPPLLADVLQILPFSSLVYTPVMILLGKYTLEQMLIACSLQVFWLLVMVACSQLIWKRIQSHITIQGG
ncbi:ABC-2 family transporter protein [Streptococcus sp. 121]|uniref:ABC transporter permease n=1 Tax=Streptococcus sp. 121 TaxID=2797637 RepID=UPI0018F0CDC7|nr:ABC-2 family transporter protein [Streptococcus sp. 121]MBJ6745864.1 ABC-2 family transporter protein [Streptococcus sp. 121]